ncbi:glycosyltransferase [Sphingomonas sp. GB1N7]|uniref:glycosyltransferase n=1 Tax=Parasphingomonas caseinilytica TaxID=3096158 RepID=UPI002FC77842
MKILVLSSLYPNEVQPRHGIFIEHRVAHLARAADEIRVVAPVPWFPSSNPRFGQYAKLAAVPKSAKRRGVQVTYPRYPVIPKIGMTLAPFLMAAALYRHIAELRREFDFDVIDSYYLYPDGVATALLAKWLDVPFAMTALGSDVTQIPDHAPARRMILSATAKAAAVTTVAGALRDELVEIGARPDNISVVLHGVDLDLFSPPVDRAALRDKLGMTAPTVLCVGYLVDNKGIDLAIRAIARLSDVRLMIAGTGPCEIALKALAESLGVRDRIDFLGHVDQDSLPELYGAADVVANCSAREGISNVLLEAMACGTPLVATPVWGSPEVVSRTEAGVLTADRSDAAIADGIAHLIASPPDRAKTRAYAETFNWRDTGRQHHALLTEAVAGHCGRHPTALATTP